MNLAKQWPTRLSTVAAVTLCLLVAACGGSGGGSGGANGNGASSVDELYKAAQAAGEGKVIVYGIKTGTDCYTQFSQRFPGIKVEQQYMVGETQARLQQEHVSGQAVGDVLRTGSTTMLALIQDGILTNFVPATAASLPKEAFGPKNAMINDSKRVKGIAYNTDNLSEAEAPKSWEDLADPRFKGKIVMPDPTSPGAGQSVLQELLQSSGATDEDWLRRFAANRPAFIKGVQPAIEALKTGEYDVMLGGIDQITGPALEKGAKLKWIFPVQGATPIAAHYVGLITKAPHPNASKLLISWLVSEEGQTCLAKKESEYPVRQGVAPPPGMPATDKLPNLAPPRSADFDELKRQEQYLKSFKEVFAR